MNKQYYLIIMLLGCIICEGQNLVPNGNFESYTQLPNFVGQVNYCTGWNNCGGFGSPDYFHMNGSGFAQLPNAFPATVYPHGGLAIMGLICYEANNVDFREYISHQLLNPLTIGQVYHLSFYVTNGLPPIYNGGFGCDHFSVAFSTDSLLQTNPLVINFSPQYTSNGILYDNYWKHRSFNFTADSAYNYISFGSFVNDSVQQVQQFDTAFSFPSAYYFIDDITLTILTGTSSDVTNAPQHEIDVFPTLFSDKLNISCNNSFNHEVILFDIASKMVLRQKFTNAVTLNTEQLAKGIYLYEVRNKNGVIKKGKLAKG